MSGKKRRSYGREFKMEAMKLATGGYSHSSAAGSLGI